MLKVADLAQAGLVEVADGETVSISDDLDNDYLHGFLRSAANIRRSTSASGSFRIDFRGSRIPQMGIDEQRQFGDAFRAIAEFEQRVKDLTELAQRAVTLAHDGLTRGTLRPPIERRRHAR